MADQQAAVIADQRTPDANSFRPASPSRSALFGAMVLIFAATCVAYAPVIHAKFVWDDDAHITKPELRSWHGLGRIWVDVGATQQYYPLLHSFFWIQWQLWGDHPLGYHLINVLLHAAAASLVFLILRKLAVPGALLAAAIFALHPVMVESVAWITEQKNTLSAVFYLSSMLVYLHFDQARKPALYFAALALFILGLLSKTVTATLPAALLVILWWQSGSLSWRRDVRPLVPFFLLGANAGLFTAWVERTLIGAEGAAFELSIVDRGLLAGRVIWFYFGKLLWPTNLTFVYPRWQVDAQTGWQWLFPLAALLLLIVLWRIRSRWRAPLAAWLFFVGTLFPVLGLFNVYPFVFSFVADHFQYLASLGLIVLAAAGLALAISHLPHAARWIGHVLCVAMLGTLATLTWQQAEMYIDLVALYQTTIDKNPTCWMAYSNLGVILANTGQPQEAIEYYQRALQIRPDYAEAQNNLGAVLVAVGRTSEAMEHYQRALQIRPDYVEACNNLGLALLDAGHPQEAIDHLQHALRLKPDSPEVHNNLGNALLRIGRLPEAIEHIQQALRFKPDYAAAHYNLGDALSHSGSTQEAIEHYQQAIRINPKFTSAYLNLALAYAELHRFDEAIATANQALELARSKGQTEVAAKIDAWLTTHHEQLDRPTTPGSGAATP